MSEGVDYCSCVPALEAATGYSAEFSKQFKKYIITSRNIGRAASTISKFIIVLIPVQLDEAEGSTHPVI